ncbi:hypothetical protein CATYP_08760 [Corynebacterium atypicum]|uniref:Mycothiol acetyltransferase n=1 Tax=Corynebacterium atypicum TaxID=191610 RepID=A0ABM5QP83_9CORY|nr:mycothiol synthase [Corynebacterium atypicum]AIG64639.1 hypothetical protein CATYP_08760 [Corynebacterium atypicum]
MSQTPHSHSAASSFTLQRHAPDAEEAAQLVRAGLAHDGFEALSEQFVKGLSQPELGHAHVLAHADGQLVGLAASDGETGELVVAPDYRRRGVGTALARELAGVPLWAHGDVPAAQVFARALGLRPTRQLLVLALTAEKLGERPGSAGSGEAIALPAGLEAVDLEESVRRWGRDWVLEQWLAVNNDAFSWHPEQGGWDLSRLEAGMASDWFEPGGVWFIWDESRRKLAGFHWTKWHGADVPGGELTGEVYVIGLAGDYRGRHLGDPLLELGLSHLAGRGAERVILYVESDNAAAVKAYERRGFMEAERHVVYAPASDPAANS